MGEGGHAPQEREAGPLSDMCPRERSNGDVLNVCSEQEMGWQGWLQGRGADGRASDGIWGGPGVWESARQPVPAWGDGMTSTHGVFSMCCVVVMWAGVKECEHV